MKVKNTHIVKEILKEGTHSYQYLREVLELENGDYILKTYTGKSVRYEEITESAFIEMAENYLTEDH